MDLEESERICQNLRRSRRITESLKGLDKYAKFEMNWNDLKVSERK